MVGVVTERWDASSKITQTFFQKIDLQNASLNGMTALWNYLENVEGQHTKALLQLLPSPSLLAARQSGTSRDLQEKDEKKDF